MYAVKASANGLFDKLNRHLERGLITRREWASEVHTTAQENYALGHGVCSIEGCNFPAMWRAIMPKSTVATRWRMHLCAGCVEWRTDALLLEPITPDAVYRPEIGYAIDRNNASMGGHWSVWREGSLYDSMIGYGYPWAMGTLRWLCRPEWVTHGEVVYVNPDTGYSTMVHRYLA